MSKPKNEIVAFYHCGKCVAEMPEHLVAHEWQFVEVGATEQGIQVWCKRHDMEIIHLAAVLVPLDSHDDQD